MNQMKLYDWDWNDLKAEVKVTGECHNFRKSDDWDCKEPVAAQQSYYYEWGLTLSGDPSDRELMLVLKLCILDFLWSNFSGMILQTQRDWGIVYEPRS
jgi:hypothetical protein